MSPLGPGICASLPPPFFGEKPHPLIKKLKRGKLTLRALRGNKRGALYRKGGPRTPIRGRDPQVMGGNGKTRWVKKEFGETSRKGG